MVLFVSKLSYHFFRYWDESRGEDCKGGEVVDEFLATHEVGHEPADIQVRHIMETLEKSNIAAAKMVCFSWNYVTVIQKTSRLLTEAVKAANCPKLVNLL